MNLMKLFSGRVSSRKLQRHLAEVVRIMETDDLKSAKKLMPPLSSDRVVEIAFHKARLENFQVSHQKRHESAVFLSERGFSRIRGGDPFDALNEASA